jgi:hypothetical protein
MNSTDPQPKLPTWLFIATDLALIAAAALIAYTQRPLSTTMILVIVGCIGAGALIALVPLVARHEQLKNEALDDRQRALEALARTVSSSAEQISIAANGLHEIAELSHRNLKHAEQLPHKLQDKIAEFQAQLATVEDAEKEELERELLALRTSESERLDSVSQRIAKSTAEWTKLEAATSQHLAAANEALGKLALGTAGAIGKAQAAAEQALTQARVEAARTIGEAGGQATRAIDTAKGAALAELDSKLSAATSVVVEKTARELEETLKRVTRDLERKLASLAIPAERRHAPVPDAPVPEPAPSASGSEPTPAAESSPAPAEITSIPVAAAAAPAEPSTAHPHGHEANANGSSQAEAAPVPVKRTRKPRREEPAAPATAEAPVAPAPEIPAATVEVPSAPSEEPAVPAAAATTSATHQAETAETHGPTTAAAAAEPDLTPEAAAGGDEEANKSSRRRVAARKPETSPDADPGLGLDLGDNMSAAAVSERMMTSDGATRLMVTAYIGIGNRLFIRGEGPGLNWDKGVPLQFVSIGKWRWETTEANGPIHFKLYKNDAVECSALGAQTLEPGHQQEVTAAF